MSNFKHIAAMIVMSTLAQGIRAQNSDVYLGIIQKEFDREFEVLNQENPPVHYMDYRYELTRQWNIKADMGNILSTDSSTTAYFKPHIRVGSPEFDNYHVTSKRFPSYSFPDNAVSEPNDLALSQLIWHKTLEEYKQSRSNYFAKKNMVDQAEDSTTDFTGALEPVQYYETPMAGLLPTDFDKLRELISKASDVFSSSPDLKSSGVFFSYKITRKYFVSSEGRQIVQNFPLARISIRVAGLTQDGMEEVSYYDNIDRFDPTDLINESLIMERVNAVLDKTNQLRNAPAAEPYTGPAIVSAEAAGVFFHEILGHRVEGHKLKDIKNEQTFKKKVGKAILPESFSIIFDPTLRSFGETDLNGHYTYDDQGVKGLKVSIVEDGVLKNFLMSRTPLMDFQKSNGHGRGDSKRQAVSRQSNLLVQINNPKTEEELRKMLLKACKKQKLKYGYLFKKVTGGYTSTGRSRPNAINVTPIEVYRVYVDKRADELVRGVNLIGTPLNLISSIDAGGNSPGVFNGMCGAESGSVPVSAISPSIFVRKVETQKKNQKYSSGPILSAPTSSSPSN